MSSSGLPTSLTICMLSINLTRRRGIPLIAIQNAARLQGCDIYELNKALGEEGQDVRREVIDLSVLNKVIKKNAVNKEDKATAHSAKIPLIPFFATREGAVAFPSSIAGQHMFPLTDLVRKMVQTVQKTSRVDSVGAEMVVDEFTLYHALGSLKGVKFARDEYNSTVGARGMDTDLIQSKRHGFVEMATSIGKILPNGAAKVDIEGLDDLIDHIENAAHIELDRGRALLKDGHYDFDSIHTLYPPGSFVVAKHAGGSGVDCFCQVIWHRYTQGNTISGKPMKYFQVCCRFIVPVGGGHSTFAEVVEGIQMFEGRRTCSVGDLAFIPPLGHEKYNLRGEMYNRVTCVNGQKTHIYMAYDKGSFYQKRGGYSFNAGMSSVALATSGRIVVDFDAASENGHSISVGRDDMIKAIQMKLKEYKLYLCLFASVNSNCGNVSATAGGMILFSKIPDEYLTLVWPTTVGFSFTSKAWGDVIVDGLKIITFDPNVFERLVIPDARKRMIKALVKHTSASGFQDLVEGKGEGTVFLLYGPVSVCCASVIFLVTCISDFIYDIALSLAVGKLSPQRQSRNLCIARSIPSAWVPWELPRTNSSAVCVKSSDSRQGGMRWFCWTRRIPC